jgi:hypothetical protein
VVTRPDGAIVRVPLPGRPDRMTRAKRIALHVPPGVGTDPPAEAPEAAGIAA